MIQYRWTRYTTKPAYKGHPGVRKNTGLYRQVGLGKDVTGSTVYENSNSSSSEFLYWSVSEEACDIYSRSFNSFL